ncbi:hypothetical protein ABK040_001578 [Willaertia magna]
MASWLFSNYLLGENESNQSANNNNTNTASPTLTSTSGNNSVGSNTTNKKRIINKKENVLDIYHRIETSSLYDDKIEAIELLVEYSKYYPTSEFLNFFNKLIKLLNQQDLMIIKLTLEIIINLTHFNLELQKLFLNKIIENDESVEIILSLYHHDSDYYIKYHTTQLINLLLNLNSEKVQFFIFKCNTITKIVNLLNESQIIIRNEGITLLRNLSILGNDEMKKVIVFEGIFEKCFEIIFEELKHLQNNYNNNNNNEELNFVILYCLDIIYNLLINNEPNRKQFIMLQNGINHLYFLLNNIYSLESQLIKKEELQQQENNNNNSLQSTTSSILQKVLSAGAQTLSSYLNEEIKDDNYSDEEEHAVDNNKEQQIKEEEEQNRRTSLDNNKKELLNNLEETLNITNENYPIIIISRVLDILIELLKTKQLAMKEMISETQIFNIIIQIALDNINNNKGLNNENLMIDNKSLFLLGHLCYNNRKAQEQLESFIFQPNPLLINKDKTKLYKNYLMIDELALNRLCKLILYLTNTTNNNNNNNLQYIIQNGKFAFHCLKRYLSNNKEGQLMIASTIKSPLNISTSFEEGMLTGILLSNSIFNSLSIYGVSILNIIIRQNSKCKDILLEIPYQNNFSFFTCLIQLIIYLLKTNEEKNFYFTISLLQLCCEWINGSLQSTRKFLENIIHFIVFIESINNSYIHPFIQSLCSLFLGILVLEMNQEQYPLRHFSLTTITNNNNNNDSNNDNTNNDSSDNNNEELFVNKSMLIEMIKKKIGIERMKEYFNYIKNTEYFMKANSQLKFNYENLDFKFELLNNMILPFMDIDFITMCNSLFDNIINCLNSNNEKTSTNQLSLAKLLLKDEEQDNEMKKQINELENEISQLKNQNENLNKDLNQSNENYQNERLTYVNENQKLKKRITELSERNSKLEQDANEMIEKHLNLEKELKDKFLQNYQEQIYQLNNQMNLMKENYENEIKSYEIKLNLNNDQLNNLNLQLKQKNDEFENVLKDLELKDDLIKRKENEFNNLQNNKINELQSQINNLLKQLKEKEERIEELDKDNEDMMDIIEKLELKLQNYEK